MAFLTVEDYLGSYEVIAFSSVYGGCQHLLVTDAVLGFEGKSNVTQSGEVKLLLDKAFSLDEALRDWPRQVHLHLGRGFSPERLAGLEAALREHPGGQEVVFHLVGEHDEPVVVRARGLKVETGPWLRDFLRAHRDELTCRLTGRPIRSGRGNGGNGRAAWGG